MNGGINECGSSDTYEAGDSSVVEPAPPDTRVKRLWVRITLSPPAGPLCHRCAPTCLNTEGSLALKAHLFFSVKALRQSRNFNLLFF